MQILLGERPLMQFQVAILIVSQLNGVMMEGRINNADDEEELAGREIYYRNRRPSTKHTPMDTNRGPNLLENLRRCTLNDF